MILRILLYGLVIYLLYKLVFEFIIPVYRAGKQIRNQFKDVKDRMQERNDFHSSSTNKPSSNGNHKVGEYIDFEEVKHK